MKDQEFVHALPLLIIFLFIAAYFLVPFIMQIVFINILNFFAYIINPVKYRKNKFIDRKKFNGET